MVRRVQGAPSQLDICRKSRLSRRCEARKEEREIPRLYYAEMSVARFSRPYGVSLP